MLFYLSRSRPPSPCFFFLLVPVRVERPELAPGLLQAGREAPGGRPGPARRAGVGPARGPASDPDCPQDAPAHLEPKVEAGVAAGDCAQKSLCFN